MSPIHIATLLELWGNSKMSFEIGKAFNRGAEWICSSSAIYSIIRNPIITALLITTLSLIIIYMMYKKDLKGTSWRRGFKTGFWLIIGISALIFVHYYVLERSLRTSQVSQGVRNVIESIHHSATTGGGYAVYPETHIDHHDTIDEAGNVIPPEYTSSNGVPPNLPHRSSRPDNVAPRLKIDDLGLKDVVLTSVI